MKIEVVSPTAIRIEDATDAGLKKAAKKYPMTESLDLSWSKNLTNDGLANLSAFKRLQELNLTGCYWVTDAGMKQIADLTQLKKFRLSGTFAQNCSISNDALASLGQLTELEELELAACNQITVHGFRALNRLKKLTTLSVTNCPCSSPNLLQYATELTNLQKLDLSCYLFPAYWITDETIPLLTNLPSLRCLGLVNASITDAGLEILAGLPQLVELDLKNNDQITDVGTARLWARCPNLLRWSGGFTNLGLKKYIEENPETTHLDLSASKAVDVSGFQVLGGLGALKSLELHCRTVERVDWDVLAKLPHLEELTFDVDTSSVAFVDNFLKQNHQIVKLNNQPTFTSLQKILRKNAWPHKLSLSDDSLKFAYYMLDGWWVYLIPPLFFALVGFLMWTDPDSNLPKAPALGMLIVGGISSLWIMFGKTSGILDASGLTLRRRFIIFNFTRKIPLAKIGGIAVEEKWLGRRYCQHKVALEFEDEGGKTKETSFMIQMKKAPYHALFVLAFKTALSRLRGEITEPLG